MNTLRSVLSATGRLWRSGCLGKGAVIFALFVLLGICGMPFRAATPPAATPVAERPTDRPTTPTIEPTVAPTATAVPTRTPFPTLTPEPTTVPQTPTTGPDPAVVAYFRQAGPALSEIGDGLSGFGRLFDKPQFGDTSWQLQVAAQIAKIRNGHEAMTKIQNVPPAAQLGHDKLLDATSDCDEGAQKVAKGLDNADASEFQEATALIQSCHTKQQEAEKLMEPILP